MGLNDILKLNIKNFPINKIQLLNFIYKWGNSCDIKIDFIDDNDEII